VHIFWPEGRRLGYGVFPEVRGLLRKELKERFIEGLTPAEKAFFLKQAREAVLRGYRASDDLFHYCYFLTLKERLRTITPERGEGRLRFMLVEGMRDAEEAIKLYRERLEANRSAGPTEAEKLFVDYLSD
jgi:hypothetical protein